MELRATVATLALAAFAGIAAVPATVTITEAVRGADGVSIAGTADLGAPGRTCTVAEGGGWPTSFSDAGAADALGLDLVDACIEPTDDGLRFVWVMDSPLPEQVPPEGVRYTWAFQAGEQTLQLQAKRTNVANATTAEDPVGHVQHLANGDVGWFQVRGACVTEYLGTPVQGCYHLDFVEGGFDNAAGEVWMELPFDPRDDKGRPYATDFLAGNDLREAASAGMSIAASGQAVVSNTTTSAYINGWEGYCTADTVLAGLGGPVGVTPSVPLEVADDGSFAATLSGEGSHAHVAACRGFRYASGVAEIG